MSRKNSNDAALGCVVQALLIVFLLPIVGLYYATRKDVDEESRTMGWVLFAIGIVIWIVFVIIK